MDTAPVTTAAVPSTLRLQVGDLLLRIRLSRGQTRAAWAEELGVARQVTMGIEKGGVSYDRLDEIGQLIGVRFALVAFDQVSGDLLDASADQLGAFPATAHSR